MGFGDEFDYKSSEEIFDEIRRFCNPRTGYDLRGVSYERLRETPLQWPVPPGRQADSDRNPIRYLNDGVSQDCSSMPTGTGRGWRSRRRRGGRCSTPARTWPPPNCPTTTIPFVLNTGRLQHQWHTMTKTGKVAKLNKLNPGPFVEIHPDDAAGSASPTASRSRSPRAAAGPCCPPSSPTGCGRATVSRRSTGTTCTAST